MYEIFEQLLQSFSVTAYKVAKETGVTQSTLSDWKRGRSTPKSETMKKLADYFGVSVDYLMTGEEKKGENKYYLNDETAKAAQEIFENKELRMLFDVAHDADPEDLRALHGMALALKRKERGYSDDTGC